MFYNMEVYDESKITIPRRNAIYSAQFLSKKIAFLYSQLLNEKRQIYQDSKYIFDLNFREIDKNKQLIKLFDLTNLDNKLTDIEKNICSLLEHLCYYFFSMDFFEIEDESYNGKLTARGKTLKEKIEKKKISKLNFKNFCDYYEDCFIITIQEIYDIQKVRLFGEEREIVKKHKEHIKLLISILQDIKKGSDFFFESGLIRIEISSETNIDLVVRLIEATIDVKLICALNGIASTFESFFSSNLYHLSDGEHAFLDIMTTINEQLTYFSNLSTKKDKFILLLDEPEIRMHPELMRTFIFYLVSYLKTMDGKQFHLIITSHSPFLASDLQKANIILLEKNKKETRVSKPSSQTFYQNIHTLLTDNFFMSKTHGEFASNIIEEIIQFIKQSQNEDSIDYQKVEKYKKMVCLVGEPIIQKNLLLELDKFSKFDEVDRLITQYSNLTEDQKERLNKFFYKKEI